MTNKILREHFGVVNEASEKYSFKRTIFPWEYNEHNVIILKNDGYIADDDRLFLHLTAFCRDCELTPTYRGKLFQDEHLLHRVQTVKMLTLYEFHKEECDMRP